MCAVCVCGLYEWGEWGSGGGGGGGVGGASPVICKSHEL